MKKIIYLLLLCFLTVFSSFTYASSDDESDSENPAQFGIHFGFGLELAGAVSTSFPEEKIMPSTNAWKTEGLIGGNFFFGFRVHHPLDETFSFIWGLDYLSINARYEISKGGDTLARWTFRAPCLYAPLELQIGQDVYLSLGAFFNLIISNPSYEDSNADEGYTEKDEVEEKYYNKLTYGFTIGFGVKSKKGYLYLEYRHGLKPWLKTPYEEASMRSVMMGYTIWFN